MLSLYASNKAALMRPCGGTQQRLARNVPQRLPWLHIAIANDGLVRMLHGWQHPTGAYFARPLKYADTNGDGKLSISETRLEGPTMSTPQAKVVGVNVRPTRVA